jgi:hypothetical protein
MPITQLQHRFVDGFPDRLQPGVLYISIEFASMSHLCCCGCGREVITPLSPKDWKFTYDGASVSVHPSIGNWSLPCRSHYIIQSGRIRWAGDWSDEQISASRHRDLVAKRGPSNQPASSAPPVQAPKNEPAPDVRRGFWSALWNKLVG